MKELSIQQLRTAIAGKWVGTGKPSSEVVTAVSIDSRAIKPGSVFFAIEGERFDGHEFVQSALESGAICAVVARLPPGPKAENLIQVDNTRVALGKLARFVRQQFRSTKVIAVAGSNGKTGTKHMIHAALSRRFAGSMSKKSFNNDIGVPLTIFDTDESADFVIVEMGTNHPGEILALTQIALPDIAIITGCAEEHLEHLRDIAGVRRENSSIVAGLQPRGALVVHGDDPELTRHIASIYRGLTIRFGLERNNDLFATDITVCESGTQFKLNGRQIVRIPALGAHNACNALSAIAVAKRLGVPDDAIVAGLGASTSPEMRMQMLKYGGVTVIHDAYNANPSSMRAAISTLSELETAGRRVAVLGEMRELGDAFARCHRDIGQAVAGSKIDVLVGVESGGNVIVERAVQAGFAGEKHTFASSRECAQAIPSIVRNGDLVLVKGSRSVEMEHAVEAIARGFQSPVGIAS
jgi:UDP-N-acetylmuramoyl-tripeptide--D-alanyl-D-alanine ligase